MSALDTTPGGTPPQRATLLMAEDEALIASAIRDEIESMGHQVCAIADTAANALAIARRVHPDLALVDTRLKGEVDGIDLAEVLRHELGVPVIYLTSGDGDGDDVRRAAQTMPHGYLTKPPQTPELRAAIAIALHNAAMERRLHASEQRFHSAFDHAPLGMAIVSAADGAYVEMNEAMRQLLGAGTRPLDGLRHDEVSLPDELPQERQRLGPLLSGEVAAVQFEKHFRHLESGQTVPTLVSVSLLPTNSHPPNYLYQLLDLRAHKMAAAQEVQLEAQRVHAAATELTTQAKNEFLSRMSHELRTPLNAILGFAQLLKLRDMSGVPGADSYVDHILQAGEHLVALLEDVLDLQRAVGSRLPLQLGPVALADSVERALHMLAPAAAEQGVHLESEVPPDLVAVADEMRLRQVLLNLSSNAVKYNQPGGTARWRGWRLPRGRVVLVLEDTGCGIQPASMAKLFEPFDRLGQHDSTIPGTGLGLLIARTLVEDMGGSLKVASTPGKGTAVTIELPSPPQAHASKGGEPGPTADS